MFVRKKKNKSGKVSIQIIDKSSGKYKLIKTVGCSADLEEINYYYRKAKQIIEEKTNDKKQLKLGLNLLSKQEEAIGNFVKGLTNANVRVIGPELVFGKLFDKIGFNKIKDELFRDLVITRLAYPGSKLKTVDYLQRYKGKEIPVVKIYRFLDKLQSKYQKEIEQISFNYTKKLLKGKISMVFYDMTTLYFEAEAEDDLRKRGFSKDGKFHKPQIMVGLLVGEKGYPIGYDIFEGNTFEGHTLIPIVQRFEKKYQLNKPIIIADAGLLSKDNIKELKDNQYGFILGGRIKNESQKIKDKILEQTELNKKEFFVEKEEKDKKIKSKYKVKTKNKEKDEKMKKERILVTYLEKRAKKDRCNRERGLRKLEERVKSKKLTKSNINNRGYNKFLALKGKIEIKIDQTKIEEDRKWDGLKGYVTNTQLKPKQIVENYSNLWQIEKAFRISKTDLKIRPIFHRVKRRIEAHICISFVAYAIFKDLERILEKEKTPLSVKRAAELTQNMYALSYFLPHSQLDKSIILGMDDEQNILNSVVERNS